MQNPSILPTARREGLITEALPSELLIYDLDTHRAHSLNPTASLVWEHCDGKRTYLDMAHMLASELGAPVSEDLVHIAVTRLNAAGLIAAADGSAKNSPAVTRRAVMSKLAMAGALSVFLPVVHTIVAPTPAQAQTCINPGGAPPGGPCNQHADCCSDRCIPGQGVCR
jgi:hypothetical protein